MKEAIQELEEEDNQNTTSEKEKSALEILTRRYENSKCYEHVNTMCKEEIEEAKKTNPYKGKSEERKKIIKKARDCLDRAEKKLKECKEQSYFKRITEELDKSNAELKEKINQKYKPSSPPNKRTKDLQTSALEDLTDKYGTTKEKIALINLAA